MAAITDEAGILAMRIGGKILARALESVAEAAREGVSLLALDTLAREIIESEGGAPAFLGYRPEGARKPFPATLCTSLNEVIVHGIPTERRLASGDLLKLDLGVRYKGWYADAAVTIPIGVVSPLARRLITATNAALDAGMRAVHPGATVGDIGYAIEKEVDRHGFRVVEGLTGHGIGRRLHDDPPIPNEGKVGHGMRLRPGHTLALEPMVSAGKNKILERQDESYATADGSLSAHFESTILVTQHGCEVLTRTHLNLTF